MVSLVRTVHFYNLVKTIMFTSSLLPFNNEIMVMYRMSLLMCNK